MLSQKVWRLTIGSTLSSIIRLLLYVRYGLMHYRLSGTVSLQGCTIAPAHACPFHLWLEVTLNVRDCRASVLWSLIRATYILHIVQPALPLLLGQMSLLTHTLLSFLQLYKSEQQKPSGNCIRFMGLAINPWACTSSLSGHISPLLVSIQAMHSLGTAAHSPQAMHAQLPLQRLCMFPPQPASQSPPSGVVKGALHKVDGHPQHGGCLQHRPCPVCDQLPDLHST